MYVFVEILPIPSKIAAMQEEIHLNVAVYRLSKVSVLTRTMLRSPTHLFFFAMLLFLYIQLFVDLLEVWYFHTFNPALAAKDGPRQRSDPIGREDKTWRVAACSTATSSEDGFIHL